MKGIFNRTSPASFAEKIGIPMGWFVISHNWMSDKKSRRLNHGKWFKIESKYGHIYRILRFSAKLPGTPRTGKGEVVLDWPGWIELYDYAEDVDGDLELSITKVTWWQYPKMALSHPDPSHKLAGELGLLSAALGALSLAIALFF